MVKCGNAVVR